MVLVLGPLMDMRRAALCMASRSAVKAVVCCGSVHLWQWQGSWVPLQVLVPLPRREEVVAPKWGVVCPWLSIGATFICDGGQGRAGVRRRDRSHFSNRG